MGAAVAHIAATVVAATAVAASDQVEALPASSTTAFVHTIMKQPRFTVRVADNVSGIEVGVLSAARIEDIAALEFHEVGEYCFRWGLYHELPPSDVVQAKRWYGRGARLRHQGCTTMLGKLHLAKGEGLKATELLLKTAAPRNYGGESGDSLAQWFLAEMNFQSGELRKAVRWWKRSAENGDVDAMYRLAEVFTDGALGIPQEAARGKHWLFAAAAHGHQMALSRVSLSNGTSARPKVEQRWLDRMEAMGWV